MSSVPTTCQIDPPRSHIVISWSSLRRIVSGGNASRNGRPVLSMPFHTILRPCLYVGSMCQYRPVRRKHSHAVQFRKVRSFPARRCATHTTRLIPLSSAVQTGS